MELVGLVDARAFLTTKNAEMVSYVHKLLFLSRGHEGSRNMKV
jgi:hypothetical protein